MIKQIPKRERKREREKRKEKLVAETWNIRVDSKRHASAETIMWIPSKAQLECKNP